MEYKAAKQQKTALQKVMQALVFATCTYFLYVSHIANTKEFSPKKNTKEFLGIIKIEALQHTLCGVYYKGPLPPMCFKFTSFLLRIQRRFQLIAA
jgi:hypothetical protein